MPSLNRLREEWDDHARSHTFEPVMTLAEDGMVLGRGTVLARWRFDDRKRPELAYGAPIDPRVLGNIRRASKAWRAGETCLALIHLARTGLQNLPDEEAAYRLFAADRLLASGIGPQHLLEGCDIDRAVLDLLKAGFNPDEARVPAGEPDGGQWTGDDGSSAAPAPRRPGVILANFTPVHELPTDATVVVPPDGVPIQDVSSQTGKLMAPPHADFHKVYAAGLAIASLSYVEQYSRGHAAVAHGGTFDFQRDVATKKLYHAYEHASNYAVGVYMAGAGYSLRETLGIAEAYALFNSSNFGSKEQKDWTIAGWNDATAGRWK
jgi:hypothetical protein